MYEKEFPGAPRSGEVRVLAPAGTMRDSELCNPFYPFPPDNIPDYYVEVGGAKLVAGYSNDVSCGA